MSNFENFKKTAVGASSVGQDLSALCEKYQEKVPQEIIQLWADNGFCRYAGGTVWSINPDNYRETVNFWLGNGVEFDPEDYIPVFRTVFGNFILFEKNCYGEHFYVLSLSLREIDSCFKIESIDDFFGVYNEDDSYMFENVELDLMWHFADAEIKPGNEQCFSFIKALYDGGAQIAENVTAVNFEEFIAKETEALRKYREKINAKYALSGEQTLFKDENLQLAVHEELNVLNIDTDEIYKELTGVKASSYALMYEELPHVRMLYNNYQFSTDQLEQISTISYGTSSPQKSSIYNQWDGEDETFTITSLEGIRVLKNLKSLEIECLMEHEIDLSPLVELSHFESLSASDSFPDLEPLVKIPTFASLSLTGYMPDKKYLERNRNAFVNLKKNGVEISMNLFNDDVDWESFFRSL